MYNRSDVEWFGSLHQARERLAQWRDQYNLQGPHSALKDKTPASFASSYGASATCFIPIERNTQTADRIKGSPRRQKNAALDPVPRLPENAKYRGQALSEIANARGSLVGAQSTRLDLDGKGFEDQGNYNAAATLMALPALSIMA
jgi:hypothetical protein